MSRITPTGLLTLIVALCLSLCLTCGKNETRPDGGDEGGDGGGTCSGGTDKSVDWNTASELSAGKEVTGTICPVKDQDYYKVTVPEGSRLLHLKLQGTVAVTNVDLTYAILKVEAGKEAIIGKAPPWTLGGIRTFDDFHCLGPGIYYIMVHDEGDDEKDGANAYKLSYTTEKDPDTGEPGNNEPKGASAPSGQPATISCNGDIDYTKVTLGPDQLLEVKLSTTQISRVDFKYTLYDEKQIKIAEEWVADGTKAKADLNVIHTVPKAGTYFIAVEDKDGDESDPKTTYILTATAKDEPDPGDRGTRNDSPATATVLGSFDDGDAPKTFTHQGQLASKADVDYFKIDGLAGFNENKPAVMEVRLDFGGPSTVDPQVAYIYPHRDTPCTKDSCCRVLKQSCNSEFDCIRQTYACVNKADIFCSDPACTTEASLACPTEKACAGAVVCLPEGACGGEQVVRSDDNGSDGAMVITAQPLIHAGPWYLRVSDLKNDDYEYGKTYTLTVKIRADPDGAKELNSQYFPIQVSSAVGTTSYHVEAAKAKAVHISTGAAVTGYISYEGDQDWYLFNHPCPGKDCTFKVTFSTGPGCPAATQGVQGSGLEFVYTLHRDDGEAWFRFPQTPAPGLSGSFGAPDQCLYAFAKDTGEPYTYFFSVSDLNHNSWSWECGYTFTISPVTEGCNGPCIVKQTNNGPECSTN